jgi:excisionase family DNA binding protein
MTQGGTKASRVRTVARRAGLLTRREAAEITGSSLSTINKAIEQRVLPVHREGRQPLLDTDALVLIKIFSESPVPLPLEVKRDVREWVVKDKPYRKTRASEFAVQGGVLVIRCTGKVRDSARDGERYAKYRDRFIVSDPNILGGAPVIRGTRMLASTVARRIDGGDTFERLRNEFPTIPAAAFEAAYRYAKANPKRGRPTKPWHTPKVA